MQNLEIYREYFDEAYPDYADHQYDQIRQFILSLPITAEAITLLNSEEARRIYQLLIPVIKIKNYKSHIPFPIELYEAALIIVNIKNSTSTENMSETHIALFNDLLDIQGFQLPTVSAVLHFCHPSVFPIVDRNIEAACKLLANDYADELQLASPSLPVSTTSNSNKLEKYVCFMEFLNRLSMLHNQEHETNYGLRELDKALMVFGVERHKVDADNANNAL